MFWQCPNCSEPLEEKGTTLRCSLGHSFDRAKQGYCNLLLANQKASANPGDSVGMLRDRRRFLEGGHYQPLVNFLLQLLTPQPAGFTLLDCGCGEGYYSRAIRRARPDSGFVSAIDIARDGVRMAASAARQQRLDQIGFAVASAARLPVLPASQDCVLSVFAPVWSEQLCRVLRSGGCFIRVSPAAEHQRELKQVLYKDAREHSLPEPLAGLTLDRVESLVFPVTLGSAEDIAALIGMTPYAWHGNSADRQALIDRGEFRFTAAFRIELWSMSQ